MSRSLIVKDQAQDRFRFSHLSVREFLEKDGAFSNERAHETAAIACLHTLLGGVLPSAHTFHDYAMYFWAFHCSGAGPLRRHKQLGRLFCLFFEKEDTTNNLKQLSTLRGEYDTISTAYNMPDEVNLGFTVPLQRIHVACAYGWLDVVQSEYLAGVNPDIRDNYNRGCLEIAARCGQTGIIAWLSDYQRSLALGSSVKRTILLSAFESSIDVFSTVLKKLDIDFIGEQLLTRFLNRIEGKEEHIEALVSHNIKLEMTEEVLCSAASSSPYHILQLLISTSPNVTITEKVVICLLSSSYIPLNTLAARFQTGEFQVTKPILLAAAEYSPLSLFKQLLEKGFQSKLGDKVMSQVARSDVDRIEKFKMLLNPPYQIPVTSSYHVLNTISRIMQSNIAFTMPEISLAIFETVKLLLSHAPYLEFTNSLIDRAINCCCTVESLEHLLLRNNNYVVTQKTLIRLAGMHSDRDRVLKLLLSFPTEVDDLESVFIKFVRSWHIVSLNLLLERFPDFLVTEDFLLELAQSWCCIECLELLCNRLSENLPNETILSAFALHSNKQCFDLLLSIFPMNHVGTETLVAICHEAFQSEDKLQSLLRKFPDTQINEAIFDALGSQRGYVLDSFNTLKAHAKLQAGNTFRPSQRLLEIFVAYPADGLKIVERLLEWCPELQVTDRVILRACENDYCDVHWIRFLLEAAGTTSIPHEGLLKICQLQFHGPAILEYLSSVDKVEYTADMVQHATYGLSITKMQFFQRNYTVIINKEFVVRCIRQLGIYPESIYAIGYLLEQAPDIVMHDEIILAAFNRESLHEIDILMLLWTLMASDCTVNLTSIAFEKAISINQHTESILEAMLSRCGPVEINDTIREAANNNDVLDSTIIKLLEAHNQKLEALSCKAAS
jgi:hypothetical protein